MQILKVDSKEFKAQIKTAHVFNTIEFAELNAQKCQELHFLLFKDTKVRLGLILGDKCGELCSPFSAPFGGFLYNEEPRLEVLQQAISLLESYASANGGILKITLPPSIYGESFMAKVVAMLNNSQFKINHIDLNYHYNLSRFERYEEFASRSARKNLNKARKCQFEFRQLDAADKAQVACAYEVIKANREAHGYPLRMSLDDVLNTIDIIDADFFVLTHNGDDVAAAQVFHVADGVAQVVYWGDVPGYGEMRPMNMLSYKLFEHYYNSGLKVLDIGPSTEHGVPNYGLCEFKESLGCEISLKHTFILSI